MDLQFKQIELKPFLCFFFSLAVTKIVWFIVVTGKSFIPALEKDVPEISAQNSFLIFTFPFLAFGYLYLISSFPAFSPINPTQNPVLFNLYQFAFAIPAMLMMLGFVIFKKV
ncbi:MAG: hypothetical protein JEZ14_21990 [Marinilabiliaceae bacterium]|nr:hypothetical protein [Marinilabiliaceae bacterium]